MIGRRQLAVASPISVTALGRAFIQSMNAGAAEARARQMVSDAVRARATTLTDSGTSALVLALRLALPKGGTVAYPGYACVDLAAAARLAGVRVRLYDLDPSTMSPDLDSVKRALDRGVDAVVVAHLFGYAADVVSVRELAENRGVVVIEDAAQGAGGTLNGSRLGSLGDLGVLSFGRGKGLCASGGGALVGFGERWGKAVAAVQLEAAGRGWSGLAKTAIQWGLGRPSVYAVPSNLPWLHLGEMVYHAAEEPTGMPSSATALLRSAFALEGPDVATRRGNARALGAAVARAPHLKSIDGIANSTPGYLRYAVRDVGGGRTIEPGLGVVQPYPRTLSEQPELTPVLIGGEPATPGAAELRRSLFTLPTHRFVDARDLTALTRWIVG